MSEPDGDQEVVGDRMKDAYPVDRAEFEFGNTAENYPGAFDDGRHDGQFEYELPVAKRTNPSVWKGQAVVQKQSIGNITTRDKTLAKGGVPLPMMTLGQAVWSLGYGDLGSIKPATEIVLVRTPAKNIRPPTFVGVRLRPRRFWGGIRLNGQRAL